MKMREIMFLLCTLACLNSAIQTQVIDTRANNMGWTVGNKNKLMYSKERANLYGLVPASFQLPLVIEESISDFVIWLDGIIDHVLILDLANIDSKDFTPQDSAFPVSYSRRVDTFIYGGKLWQTVCFALFFLRLQFGVAGGFKEKVIRLRARNIEVIGKLRVYAVLIMLVFGGAYIATTIMAGVQDKEYILDSSDSINTDTLHRLDLYKQQMLNINGAKIEGLFYIKAMEWPYFQVIDSITTKSGLHEDLNRDTSGGVKEQMRHFISWYPILGQFWWVFSLVLVSIHKNVFKRRLVAVSQFIAFIYAMLILIGFLLLGYKASMISLRSNICVQTLNFTRFDQVPSEGNGIRQMVMNVKEARTVNWIKSQIYSLAVGANAAYLIALNRMAALGKTKSIKKAQDGFQVKTVIDMFVKNNERDKVLSDYNFLQIDIWEEIGVQRKFIQDHEFKIWAYQLSLNICKHCQIIDLASAGLLMLCIVGLFFAFFMAWSSEFILRCIIFEEKSSIDMNKFRHDWSQLRRGEIFGVCRILVV